MSDCCLTPAISWQKQFKFRWVDDNTPFAIGWQSFSWISIVLADWNKNLRVDLLSWFWTNQSWLLLLNDTCFVGEAANTNFTVFGLNRPGHNPTIYRAGGGLLNNYIIDPIIGENIIIFDWPVKIANF